MVNNKGYLSLKCMCWICVCVCVCGGQEEVAYEASPLQWSGKSAISHVIGSVHSCSAQWDMTLSGPSRPFPPPPRPLFDRALISLLASLTNQWQGAHQQHSSKPTEWSSWIYPIMQQKPRGATLAFGRERMGGRGRRHDVHSASWSERAWSSAETTAEQQLLTVCWD